MKNDTDTPQIHQSIVDAVCGKGNLFDALCNITAADARAIRTKDKTLAEQGQRQDWNEMEYAYQNRKEA